MAKLNIPARYRAGVFQIGKLDDRTIREIRAALDRILQDKDLEDEAAQNRPDQVAMTAVTSVPEIRGDIKSIAEALAALYRVRSARDIPVEEFADDVCEAMTTLDEADLRVPESNRDEFKAKLLTLLRAEVFALVAKAHDLKTDDERTFCSARILTDLRPVFGNEIEAGPRGFVVVHLLKLGYHQGSKEHKEFYLSLDADDLETLRKTIDRAEAKAKSLRPIVKDVHLFGVPRD